MTADERFVLLVQEREILFNAKMKEHHNRNITENLWMEIAGEMNMTVHDCKQKWTNLRNSFARHLRNQNNPYGYQKRQWYLAEAMTFLKDHMQHRRRKENFDMLEVKEEPVERVAEDSGDSQCDINEAEGKRTAPADIQQPRKKQVVCPMIEFLKTNTNKSVQGSPLLDYMKGLLPEYEELTTRRQRIFKLKVITLLNDLLEEQESEGRTSTPS